MIDSHNSTFKEIKDNIKLALQKAANNPGHNLRFFTVSTFCDNAGAPQNRMVVLRKFLPHWTMRFYTDYRSSKVEQIKEHPSISLLFWNADERYQLRIQAEASVHYGSDISESEWQNINGDARKAYTTILPPGQEISGPKEGKKHTKNMNYFCVIDALPLQIKVLQLNRTDHLAMKFKRKSAKHEWNGKWIVP